MTEDDVEHSPHPAVLAACRGLFERPAHLPPWLFYDAAGSALFEQITDLPEYYLTRAERSILEHHADEIVALASGDENRRLHVVELGAGTATKSQLVLDAVVRRQGACRFLPVDVSVSALQVAAARLERESPAVSVHPVVATHEEALPAIRALGPTRLVLFLGSSIGNHPDEEAVALLRAVGDTLLPGGCVLVGADRRKDPAVLVPAYDDAAGVTAAFNRNVLVRLNREVGADFDVAAWRHEARWNAARSRIEMHLVARGRQVVSVPRVGVTTFQDGDSIHTESSRKYDPAHAHRLLREAGFHRIGTFTDPEGRFDLHLARLDPVRRAAAWAA
jgi:L-histidine N-alpha-methyltransferase